MTFVPFDTLPVHHCIFGSNAGLGAADGRNKAAEFLGGGFDAFVEALEQPGFLIGILLQRDDGT